MEFLGNIEVIAGLIALIVGLFAYGFMMPRNLDTFTIDVDTQGKDAKVVAFLARLSQELYATLPASKKKEKRPYPKIDALIISSGNPWSVSAEELYFLQFVTAFLGFFGGIIFWFILSFAMSLPFWVVIGGSVLLGYKIPTLKYKDVAKRRDLDFKRQLPEALDLIIISLSGGNTFGQALRESIPNMQEGVLKEEFASILNSIDTGRTINEALSHFGDRAPNDSIKTFVTAVREANELNVPLVEVLQSRADASREEFFALIHAKTAQLSSKMMGVLTPTLIPALLIIVLAPALVSLVETMG